MNDNHTHNLSEERLEELRKLYKDVFKDDLYSVKPCGRGPCKKLIIAMKNAFPSDDFGNASTGWMQVDNIRSYSAEIFGTEK